MELPRFTNQEIAPPGGLESFSFYSRFNRKGPPGWLVLVSMAGICLYGGFELCKAYDVQTAVEKEQIELNMCMVPFLQAEQDMKVCDRIKIARDIQKKLGLPYSVEAIKQSVSNEGRPRKKFVHQWNMPTEHPTTMTLFGLNMFGTKN